MGFSNPGICQIQNPDDLGHENLDENGGKVYHRQFVELLTHVSFPTLTFVTILRFFELVTKRIISIQQIVLANLEETLRTKLLKFSAQPIAPWVKLLESFSSNL